MPTAAFDHQVKLLLLGDSGVGKSCLLLRFSEGDFTSSFITTIGIDFKTKQTILDGTIVNLQIWDTAGQERFRTITSAYYRGAMGIVLVYDITDEASFNNVRTWVTNIDEHASQSVNKILVGNKCDMDAEKRRTVPISAGRALAKEFRIPFYETSAKDNINVDEVFHRISKDVIARLAKEQEAASSPVRNGSSDLKVEESIKLSSVVPRKSRCCG